MWTIVRLRVCATCLVYGAIGTFGGYGTIVGLWGNGTKGCWGYGAIGPLCNYRAQVGYETMFGSMGLWHNGLLHDYGAIVGLLAIADQNVASGGHGDRYGYVGPRSTCVTMGPCWGYGTMGICASTGLWDHVYGDAAPQWDYGTMGPLWDDGSLEPL